MMLRDLRFLRCKDSSRCLLGCNSVTSPWRRRQQGPPKRWYLPKLCKLSQSRKPQPVKGISIVSHVAIYRFVVILTPGMW